MNIFNQRGHVYQITCRLSSVYKNTEGERPSRRVNNFNCLVFIADVFFFLSYDVTKWS